MTRRMRRSLWSMFAALAVMVGAAAIAWACTPQAIIYLGPSSTGPAGSTITVTGKGFIPGPVEIRMDSGAPLATATGPDFSVPVRIPAAKPGVYYVNAVAYAPDLTVAGQASRALQIKAPAPERQQPVPPRQPAPPHERTHATPKQPAVHDQPAAPVETPVTAAAPVTKPVAKRAKPAARPAAPRALPDPRGASPTVPPPRKLWNAPASASPSLDAKSTSDDAGATLVVGIVLVSLGLAGLGGVGYALVRAPSRPPAPEAAKRALPIPDAEQQVVSLEDELQELIATSSARAALETSGSDQVPPRETAESPS